MRQPHDASIWVSAGTASPVFRGFYNDPNQLLWCFMDMVATTKERPELTMPKVVTGKQGDLLKTLQTLGKSTLEKGPIEQGKTPPPKFRKTETGRGLR